MLFKDIKQNYPVYILDKQSMTYEAGKATQVSFPRIEMNQKTGKAESVVDITIEANGKTATYVIPDNLSVTYTGSLILSTDKTSLISEIEALKNTAEQVLSSVSYHEGVLAKSNDLLAELNPAFKEKQETEKRFAAMENSVMELKQIMQDFINKMS